MINNSHFPYLLTKIFDPPEKLFYRGNLEVLQKTCVSIVGTRKNTDYGEYVTTTLVEALAIMDIAIVSGLAIGIDTLAHKVALANNLPTIAVLGSGIDNIVPPENKQLAKEIEKTGLVLSEYPDITHASKATFPQRNRIVSGLSIVTIVVEAPEKSGALITARLALDQNRDVFAVPGDIDRPESRGALKLLQNSAAHPLISPGDIIEHLKDQAPLFKQAPAPKKEKLSAYKLTREEERVLQSLYVRRPATLEKIMERTMFSPGVLLATLSSLEVMGFIKIKNGKYCRNC